MIGDNLSINRKLENTFNFSNTDLSVNCNFKTGQIENYGQIQMNRNYPQQKIDYKNAIDCLKYLNGNQPFKPQTLARKRNMLLVKNSCT